MDLDSLCQKIKSGAYTSIILAADPGDHFEVSQSIFDNLYSQLHLVVKLLYMPILKEKILLKALGINLTTARVLACF
jgi:hypothetical protein